MPHSKVQPMSDATRFCRNDNDLLGYGLMDTIHQEFVDLVNANLTCEDPTSK
jgi:hypothetical protein